MARRTRAEAEQTRAAILEAAIEVFLRKGVTRTTLQEIAEEAGVTRGAIYHNFANKGEMLEALLTSVELPDEIMEANLEDSGQEDPMEMLKEWCERTMEHFQKQEQANRIYTILYHRNEWVEEMMPVMQKEEAKARHVEGIFRKQFELARREGILREDLEPDEAAFLFASVAKGIYIRALAHPERNVCEIPFMVAIDAVLQGFRKQGTRDLEAGQ